MWTPVRIEVRDEVMARIKGADAVQAIKRFIAYTEREEGVSRRFELNTLHSSFHPHAHVTAAECPNVNGIEISRSGF
jgi:hypothetical protein